MSSLTTPTEQAQIEKQRKHLITELCKQARSQAQAEVEQDLDDYDVRSLIGDPNWLIEVLSDDAYAFFRDLELNGSIDVDKFKMTVKVEVQYLD